MALIWRFYPQDSGVDTIPNFKDDALNNPGVQPDRTFTSADVSASNIQPKASGVIKDVYEEFTTTISATSTTDVEITSGASNWYGYTLTAEGEYDTIAIESLPATQRIDVLVLEFDPNGSRTNYVSWKVGIESATPIPPNVDGNQIPLYEVELSSTGIMNIEDVREYIGDYFTKEEIEDNYYDKGTSNSRYVNVTGDTITGSIVADEVYQPFRGTNDDGNAFGVVNKWQNGSDRYVPFANANGDHYIIIRDEENNIINGIRQLDNQAMYDFNLGKYFEYKEEQVLLYEGQAYLEVGDTVSLNLGSYSMSDFKEVIYEFSDYDVGVGSNDVNWYQYTTKKLTVGSTDPNKSAFYGYQLLEIGSTTNGTGGTGITKAWNLNDNGTISGRTIESSEEKDVVLRTVVGILK